MVQLPVACLDHQVKQVRLDCRPPAHCSPKSCACVTGSSTRGHQGGLVTQGPKDMTSLPGQVSLEITHVDAEVGSGGRFQS